MAINTETKITPMMRQYLDIKNKYPSEILFFRLGDFYEMFFDDAKKASSILNITLTRRQANVPMCGIPYHAAENYISRIIKAGLNVAICEQLEDVPSNGNIVKRDVVRVITPGTIIESNLLSADDNNFLSSVIFSEDKCAISSVDISTGDFILSVGDKNIDYFKGELTRISPREILIKSLISDDEISQYITIANNKNIPINTMNEWIYDIKYLSDAINNAFSIFGLKGLGLESDIDIIAVGSIIEYIKETHKRIPKHLKFPKKIEEKMHMRLDDTTISHLELLSNQTDGSKQRTLFTYLNNCSTAMGKRILERNILEPLLDINKINIRQSAIEYFVNNSDYLKKCKEHLTGILDIERIISRLSIGHLIPREYLGLALSLNKSIDSITLLKTLDAPAISEHLPDIFVISEISNKIVSTITNDPAISPEHGRIINSGIDNELDRLYRINSDSKEWILNYQDDEKKRTGISTLKIRFNKILGYYIEVSKGQIEKVPSSYLRKQTLVGNERFTTEKLQEFETNYLSASEKIVKIENDILDKLRLFILEKREMIQEIAFEIGYIDFIISLSFAANQNNLLRPEFNTTGKLFLDEARHPIVEKYYTKEIFIPNNVMFDSDENIIKIITGPNMSGKSTYIRMAALIQLMGQIGSFVPAKKAELPIVDRIFTRIGASDNLSKGESTFLVEMNETATILNNATEKSLIIMDEVGRGTSTYDGLSLAWAIVEYILSHIHAKTLFATHYHEMTELSDKKGIVNYNVLVKESIRGVEFMHKVVPGAADKSYGIHVAKLAGIPREVTTKAQTILNKLEKSNKRPSLQIMSDSSNNNQIELFNAINHRIITALKNIDVDSLTPVDALNEINKLKSMIQE